ncbi:hypothetical protein TRAPUB_879 [Trametes pubescens]|uniref:F-box domain-containing protein n=1 Tax=Trametes pubescens TaxID=154538 RepID=A0A1M2VKW0_TRAPU|nr:hypothetical protein TRAPUB_879 [Trametes pubescens]
MAYLPSLNSLSYNEQMFADGRNVVFPTSFHFSPTLKAVTLVLAARSDLDRLEELIHSLSWLVTYADRLTFCSASADCRLSFPVMRTWRLHSLTSFTGQRVSVESEDLLSLGELPHLRKLDIETRTERNEYRAPPRGRQAWFFPALQDFKLHAKEALSRPEVAAAGLFTDLCTALAGLPCPDTIQYVTISLPVGDDVVNDGNLFPSPCLEPLLSLHSLRSLRVLDGCKVIVDDAMLNNMSLAWPGIRILLFE